MALYAFDGTWNDATAPDEQRDSKKDTNVHRFRLRYSQTAHYVNGVGTRYGIFGKVIGGITGAGAQRRIDEQFDQLRRAFEAGDTIIDIVGYSRGAAIARMFARHIDLHFDTLRTGGKPLARTPTIRFLGLFDTVASFGIPWNDDEGDFSRDIPEHVLHTFHAMALDETRETFGIERCYGNLDNITEVWFRGGHGDIGGNATYADRNGERSNRERSEFALNWMLAKAVACGLPITQARDGSPVHATAEAPVTSRDEPISIGRAGTLSRRIHLGDLVHHSVELSAMTRGIDGRALRRISVLTRIEDDVLEGRVGVNRWTPPTAKPSGADNVINTVSGPSLVELSLRRYPFDVLPARTWRAWLQHWQLADPGLGAERTDEFWAPNESDRALAWDMHVELQTRVAVQALSDDEGDDQTALQSIASLFSTARSGMREHGVDCANTGLLINAFLNQKIRPFTSKWHRVSLSEDWSQTGRPIDPAFRAELKELRQLLVNFSRALASLADASV